MKRFAPLLPHYEKSRSGPRDSMPLCQRNQPQHGWNLSPLRSLPLDCASNQAIRCQTPTSRKNRYFLKRVNAQKLQSSVQVAGQSQVLVDEGDQQVRRHRDPDLCFHRIGTVPEKMSQPTHRKPMKTGKNKGFSALLHAIGQSVGVKTPIRL